MQNIKYAKNICDLHSFPFYVIPPPFCQHDATYLLFMAAKLKTSQCDRCFHYAGAGKHLLFGTRVQQLDPVVEHFHLPESVTPLHNNFDVTWRLLIAEALSNFVPKLNSKEAGFSKSHSV